MAEQLFIPERAPYVPPVAMAANEVVFVTYLTPIGQPRAGARYNKHLGRVQMYEKRTIGKKGEEKREHPIVQFRYNVKADAMVAMAGRPPHDGYVVADILCIYARLKGDTYKRKPNLRLPKATKFDWDNVGKAVSDSCNGVIYKDDAQIYDGRVRKFYGEPGEVARVECRFILEPMQ